MAAPKGHDGQGGGRPKGSQNTKTLEIKQAFQNLLELNTPNMIAWLATVAEDNPAKALDICGNLAEFIVPKLARQELTGKDGNAIETKDVTQSDKDVIARYKQQLLTGQIK